MTGFDTGIVVVGCLFAGWAVGVVIGTLSERRAWTSRACREPDIADNTPHHCDGEFYYVVPEKMFCEQFTRKRMLPPQGGSGTACCRQDATLDRET